MGRGAFEIEAIARLETVVALIVEPDLKFTAQDVQEFLAFMSIRFAAAAAWFDAEKVRFHSGVAPGQEFHADLGAGFEDFALRGANEELDVPIRLKHRKDVGFVIAGDALESCDRRVHLAAFEGAEESDGNAGGACDLSQGKAAFEAHAAEGLAGRLAGVRGSSDDSLLLQNVHNRGRIEAAGAAQKDGALEQANIGFGVQTVAACGALRRDQAEGLPGAQGGGGNPEAMGDLRDTQEALARQRIR